MGRADNRRTIKSKQRKAQRKHKARLAKKIVEGKAAAAENKRNRAKSGGAAPAASTVTRRPTGE